MEDGPCKNHHRAGHIGAAAVIVILSKAKQQLSAIETRGLPAPAG